MASTGADTSMEDQKKQWDRVWERYADATRANPGQALRRRLIVRLLGADAEAPDAAILDFGCGSGDLLQDLAGCFPRATQGTWTGW